MVDGLRSSNLLSTGGRDDSSLLNGAVLNAWSRRRHKTKTDEINEK
jgi:hypothetical protein